MADIEREYINSEYDEYCKHDGRRNTHLPFIIWLKHYKEIEPLEYYKEQL